MNPATPSSTTASPPPVLPAVARGVAGAAETCIDRYGGLIWSVAKRYCQSAADAEDAVQDVFIELWRKAGDFDEQRGTEAAFVSTVARRRLIDHLRKRGRRKDVEQLGDVAATDGDDHDDEADAAREALGDLNDSQRTVITLTVFEGLSYPEIAEKLAIPLGTVKAQARRGFAAVRDALTRRREAATVRRAMFRQQRGLQQPRLEQN
ncbi:MAG: sigma-70 family RNA polymerase sigma factor [Planctomycetota bacterium]